MVEIYVSCSREGIHHNKDEQTPRSQIYKGKDHDVSSNKNVEITFCRPLIQVTSNTLVFWRTNVEAFFWVTCTPMMKRLTQDLCLPAVLLSLKCKSTRNLLKKSGKRIIWIQAHFAMQRAVLLAKQPLAYDQCSLIMLFSNQNVLIMLFQ